MGSKPFAGGVSDLAKFSEREFPEPQSKSKSKPSKPSLTAGGTPEEGKANFEAELKNRRKNLGGSTTGFGGNTQLG